MNLKIWLLALFFGTAETAYFGWNMLPQSPAEMICDGITVLLVALAILAPARARDTRCESCRRGFDGTKGNGYQPCSCKRPNTD